MTTTSFQDDFHREVERQPKELRCNDRERARGQSEYVMCIECGIGPCIAQTAFNRPSPAQIAPITDEEIASLETKIEPTLVVFATPVTIKALIARIKFEREQTIRECAEIAHVATMFTGCPLECMADEVRDAVLSLLQSKPGEGK